MPKELIFGVTGTPTAKLSRLTADLPSFGFLEFTTTVRWLIVASPGLLTSMAPRCNVTVVARHLVRRSSLTLLPR